MPRFELEAQGKQLVKNEDFNGYRCLFFFFDNYQEQFQIAEELFARLPDYDELNVMLIGINPRICSNLQANLLKKHLFFPVLIDTKQEFCVQCGVMDEKKQLIPTLFLVNEEGTLCWKEQPIEKKGIGERALQNILRLFG